MEKSAPVEIQYEDIESAFYWSSSGAIYENQALICLRTGRVFLQSTSGDLDEEELPEDIEDGTLYVAVPHRNELNLGRDLVFEFAEAETPENLQKVHAAFRQRGAYGKFKEILDRAGLLRSWFNYEAAATRSALERWASENGLVVVGPTRRDA